MKTKWMIRDVKHGKTFSFDSYDQMKVWILSDNAQTTKEMIKILEAVKENKENETCAQ